MTSTQVDPHICIRRERNKDRRNDPDEEPYFKLVL